MLTRVKIKRDPQARNVIEIKVIWLPKFHVTRVPNREALLVVAWMKGKIEESIILARLPQRKEVVHLEHRGFWIPKVAVHHVDANGEPPTVGTNLNGGDVVMFH